jgi:purine-binding chemotaxis protein CheW
MVDLVKLRKKAKESREAVGAEARAGERAGERAAGSAQRAEGLAAGGRRPAGKPAQASESAEATGQPDNPATDSKATGNRQPATESPTTYNRKPTTDSNRQPATQSATTDKLAKFKTDAGKLRQTVEQATEAQPNADTLELLTFVIAGEHYAVDIERIVEIVRPRSVTRVPNADASIVGIVSLRGTIVTLVDVRKRLRHAVAEETPDTRIIVVDHQGETIGFEVDRVLRVVKIGRGDVGGHPVVHASEADDCIRGVFRHAGALTILLDFDKLLALPHGNHL